jgi:hypothetical protein
VAHLGLIQRNLPLILSFISDLRHQFFSKDLESLSDLISSLGADFLVERNPVFLHKTPHLSFGDCLCSNVLLVGQDHDFAVGFLVLINFLDPKGAQFLKAEFVIDGIDEDDRVGPSVVG